MVRRHGWQLPAHTFQFIYLTGASFTASVDREWHQEALLLTAPYFFLSNIHLRLLSFVPVIAITVFLLLVVAFYAFFAPFLGEKFLEYLAIGIYTPVAFVVFILYIRCTRINPADPGIMARFDGEIFNGTNNEPRSSLEANPGGQDSFGREPRVNVPVVPKSKRSSKCFCLGGFIYVLFAKDDCRREEALEQDSGDDALYCTLCHAEVRKLSKHCRSCDKCVDGFDHHCRWLNNCVGRKNYISFISLMAISVVWLLIEFGVGVAVLVLCFVDKKSTESRIEDKLGNGFSRAPFAAVVAVCTAVALLACVPLGELFFFHIILIKKGITTYEYVVAMRAMSDAPPASVDEEGQNALYSPTNSATTGVSGGSSLGLQYKGVWCTPPRVFVDQQDEVVPHLDPGMVPSTVDPDSATYVEKSNKSKKPVKISAWKLAKLDSNEAMKAAARARASSSVLRPIEGRRNADTDSSNVSVRSSLSIDYGTNKEPKTDLRLSPLSNSYPQSIASKEDYEVGTQSASSLSSPQHIREPSALSPLPLQQLNPGRLNIPRGLANVPNTQLSNPLFQSANTLRENRRTSVVWDQEAGRYVSVPSSTRAENTQGTLRGRASTTSSTIPSAEVGGYGRRASISNPSSSSSSTAPLQQPERLMYTGQSIFFGGPLLANAARDDQRNEGDGTQRQTNVPRDGQGEGGRVDRLPVFNPGSNQKNPSTTK